MIFEFLQTEFPLIALIVGAIVASISTYKRKRRGINNSGASVLLSYYTEGVNLLPMASGKLGSMHYSAIITTESQILLYRVELPFSAKIHLLGIPKRKGVIQLNPAASKNLMEEVHLEGDYNKYFRLFAEKAEQTQSRYVLDPKAMVFTVDFCTSHNWEIINNELYFLQASADNPDDPTDMFNDIEQFVKEIRPAVESPLTVAEAKHAVPYGEDRRTDLLCPVCSEVMTNTDDYFMCPKGHGILLNGKMLSLLSDGKIDIPPMQSIDNVTNRTDINCPSCGNKMNRVDYNGGKEVIDSCSNCPYRWLDATEVNKLRA